MVLTVA